MRLCHDYLDNFSQNIQSKTPHNFHFRNLKKNSIVLGEKLASPHLLLTFAMFFLASNVIALPMISPNPQNCGNGISCASSQTCMSNATGAGLIYACSPLPNAVRCMDARFSCPTYSFCSDNSTCISPTSEVTDAVINVDAFEVEEFRDFGSGISPTALSICGPITNNFRLPNFCTCRNAPLGGELGCTIGLQNYISVGASAWILPCASPANLGFRAWVSLLGASQAVGRTWTTSFGINLPIPGASFDIGVANVGARAELSAEINRLIISSNFAIGVCGRIGVGFFSRELCNPSALQWLPITIIRGPRIDFSRFC